MIQSHAGRRSLLVHYPQAEDAVSMIEPRSSDCSPGVHDKLVFSSVVKPATSPPPPDLIDRRQQEGAQHGGGGDGPRGIAGMIAGDEAEEGDVAIDPSAYWQELPPGMYSLAIRNAPSAGMGQPYRGRQDSSNGGDDHSPGVCGSETPAGAIISQQHHLFIDRPLPWGLGAIESHAWADELILRVSEYVRPERSLGASTGGSTSNGSTFPFQLNQQTEDNQSACDLEGGLGVRGNGPHERWVRLLLSEIAK